MNVLRYTGSVARATMAARQGWRCVLLALLAILVVADRQAIAQTPSTDAQADEEIVPIEFELKRAGRIEVVAVKRRGRIYLPMQEVFNFLKVRNEYNAAQGTLTGFFVSPDTPYTIDSRAGTARVGKRTMQLAHDDVIIREGGPYMPVEVFDRVFGLPIEFRERQLRASLSTDVPLAIFLDRRLQRLERQLALRTELTDPEVTIDRSFTFLDGVRLDYSLRQSLSPNRTPFRTFSSRLAALVLGGDVESRFVGRISPVTKMDEVRARWRFVPPKSTIVRQVVVGDFVTSGLISRQIYGVEVSNRPAYRRSLFADQLFMGSSTAERSSYLFSNSRLVAVQPTDAQGRYVFETPIRYGSNLIDIHTYDEWGELIEDSYRILIPSSMIPPGEIEYSLSSGRLRDRGYPWYGDMSSFWGVTSWVTMGGRMEYYDSETMATRLHPTLSGVGRITDHLITEASFSPTAYTRGSALLALPSLLNASGTMTFFRNERFFNPRVAINEFTLAASYPFSLGDLRFGVDASARQMILKLFRERNVQAGFSMTTGIFNMRYSIRGGWVYSYNTLETRAAFRESDLTLRFRMPAGLIVSSGLRYDHLDSRALSLRASAFLQPIRHMTLDVQYDRNFPTASNVFRVRLQYIFPSVRVSSNYTRSVRSVTHNQQVSGSFGISPSTGDLFLDNNASRAGYGGLFVQPFQDLNNNGVRDPGEPLVSGPRVRASTGVDGLGLSFAMWPDIGWGTTRALPYQDYIVEIDRRGFENPLAIPRVNSFQVTAEPGRFLFVEIPVAAGGGIRGSVQVVDVTGRRPLERVKVRLREILSDEERDRLRRQPIERTTETFSTGEYEFFGIPPGSYQVTLDPFQVETLGLVSMPWTRQVSIEVKPDGDLVEGIDFTLRHR